VRDNAARRREEQGRPELRRCLACACPRSYTVLREGKGEVLQRANDVFYNKAQARGTAALRAVCAEAASGS